MQQSNSAFTALHNLRTYYPSLVASLLLCVTVCTLYPLYQYYVDPDATAYLTIAGRYAAGDYARAINAYWSPLACWFTALGIKAGMSGFASAIAFNVTGGAVLLFVTQSLFVALDMQRRIQWLLSLTLAGFLCYAVYAQTFDDLWECALLLLSLRLMLRDDYKHSLTLWLLNGAVGAIAYFAKAYAFPFFILNTICCGFVAGGERVNAHRRQWPKMTVITIVTMVVCSSPWLYLLHSKYGVWMTSSAGRLNASWYLAGHPFWKDNIHSLLPPVYADSPYYWEDPYVANGETPHFWSSGSYFILQIIKVFYNLLKLVRSMNELSGFFIFITVLAISIIANARVRYLFGSKSLPVALSFCLFPAGLIIINYEARYLWYMLPLSMAIGGLALQRALMLTVYRRFLTVLLMAVFAGSYLVTPIWEMRNMAYKGRDEYIIARHLQKLGIHGGFVAGYEYGQMTQKLARIAYFSGNSYYAPAARIKNLQDIIPDMKRLGVKYYYLYQPQNTGDKLSNSIYRGMYKEVTGGTIPYLQVYEINP